MSHRGRRNRDNNRHSEGSSSNRPAQGSSSSSGLTTVRCTHYARSCNLVAPCCGRIVCCHQGHDTAQFCRTSLERTKGRVVSIVCCNCKQAQPVAEVCRSCGRRFGERACLTCRLWHSGAGFHCRACGICRKGRAEDNIHCAVCDTCYPLSARNHACAVGALNRACEGCGGNMRRARRPCVIMRCGHSMHSDCFLARVRTNYSCPRRDCRKTVANMSDWYEALDAVASNQLANSPAAEINITCINCRTTSRVRVSGNYKKCPNCSNMNTVRLPTNTPFAIPPSNLGRR